MPLPVISFSRQVVRIALLVMLFQFICPAFLPIRAQHDQVSAKVTVSVEHSALVIPWLLKEKDETEINESVSDSETAPLLDLTSHSLHLTATHGHVHGHRYEGNSVANARLFSMFCTLLI